MTKASISLTIDPYIWDLATKKYPRKLSSVIEDFLKGIIDADLNIPEEKKLNEIDEKIISLSKKFSKTKEKLNNLKQLKKIKEKEEEEKRKKEEERRKKELKQRIIEDKRFDNLFKDNPELWGLEE